MVLYTPISLFLKGAVAVNTSDWPAEVGTGKATRREWMGLAIIALPCVLYAMDLTILTLAVPSLSADLKPTAAQLAIADQQHVPG